MTITIEREEPKEVLPIKQIIVKCEVAKNDFIRIFMSDNHVLFAFHRDGKESGAVLINKDSFADLMEALIELQNQDNRESD
jgi:PHD/YefM family antitoxin component YafN of YafNO toxin-antitoxin module